MEHGDAQSRLHGSLADPAIFGPIFEAHHTRVWQFLHRLGGRECADDLAGEVFLAALASRDRYDPTRGTVQSWLYGIAANLARTWHRRRTRGQRAIRRLTAREHAETGAVGVGALERIDETMTVADDARRTLAAMGELSDADREVLVLFVWEELSYKEIGETLGIAVGTVRSRLSRARERLRELAGLGGQVPSER